MRKIESQENRQPHSMFEGVVCFALSTSNGGRLEHRGGELEQYDVRLIFDHIAFGVDGDGTIALVTVGLTPILGPRKQDCNFQAIALEVETPKPIVIVAGRWATRFLEAGHIPRCGFELGTVLRLAFVLRGAELSYCRRENWAIKTYEYCIGMPL